MGRSEKEIKKITMTRTEIILTLRPLLKQYIESEGYIFNGNQVSCPIPSCWHPNGDLHPSAGLIRGTNKEVLKCLAGGRSLNIFQLAAEREGIPEDGPDLYEITIPYLCKKLGIEYEYTPVNPNRIRKFWLLRKAHTYFRQCFDKQSNKKAHEYIVKRKIEGSPLVGYIDNRDNFLKFIDLNEPEMEAFGLTPQLINSERIIFTMKDRYGMISGFQSRTIHENIDSEEKKYIKQRVDPNDTSKVFFGLDTAKNYGPSLWIVEGPIDVISMQRNGIKNVIARSGKTNIDLDTIKYLKTMETPISELILCYDGDVPIDDIISEGKDLSKRSGLYISIVQLPVNSDPDSLDTEIRNVNNKSLLEFYVDQMKIQEDYNDSKEAIADKAIRMIADCENILWREKMINDLQQSIDVEKSLLRIAVDNILIEKESTKNAQAIKMVRQALRQMEEDPNSVFDITESLHSKIQNFYPKVDTKKTYIDRLGEVEALILNHSKTINTYRLPNMPRLDAIFEYGFPKTQCLCVIAGAPHHGKTTVLRHILWEILQYNPKALNLFIATDENMQKLTTWALSKVSELSYYLINNKMLLANSEENRKILHKCTNILKSIENRFIIADNTEGNSVPWIKRKILYLKEKFPSQDIVVYIDSLHKLESSLKTGNPSTDMKETMRQISTLTNELNIPIFLTAQINKEGMKGRPTNRSILDSVQPEYSADVILMVYNELADKKGDASYVWTDPKNINCRLPIIEIEITKNRISENFTMIAYKSNGREDYLEEYSIDSQNTIFGDDRFGTEPFIDPALEKFVPDDTVLYHKRIPRAKRIKTEIFGNRVL